MKRTDSAAAAEDMDLDENGLNIADQYVDRDRCWFEVLSVALKWLLDFAMPFSNS
jgi:hypothetical protein